MSTMTAAQLGPDQVFGPSGGLGDGRDGHRPRPWMTVNVRPAGSFGRADVVRLRALLDALSVTASLVVLDLAAVSLRSQRAAEAIDEAAVELERRGGCLLCVNADDDVRAQLEGCTHAVVVAAGAPAPGGVTF
ncbi:hypothetical protein [Cellulomonas sp. URHD0024]|uniref:hypothetical protein n=1 Tax=Cellulomonas sp. URHD0024 TaxID=1302620 RepID=UPI00040BB6A0|nr:hypothetical protein [Cellulomonas sp. URHD0024]